MLVAMDANKSHITKPMIAFFGCMGVLTIGTCVFTGMAIQDANQAREHAAAQTARVQRQVEDQLLGGLPAAITQLDSAIAGYHSKIAAGDVPGATAALDSGQRAANTYRTTPRPFPQIAAKVAAFDEARRQLELVTNAPTLAATLRELVTTSDRAARRNPEAADRGYGSAIDGARRLETLPASVMRGIAFPSAADIQRKRDRVAPALERIRAAAAELAARCGPRPEFSAWDGELIGSESFIRQAANDPDSIDVERCSLPTLDRRRCWETTCDVLGRNAFGAMVRNRYRFTVVRGEIVSAR